ncbi:RsmD family RNA methyltransferase [Patescibacteria group bacterium]|nr:RsmD family RNA methyltransferase [Patescibacteria group bacterium]
MKTEKIKLKIASGNLINSNLLVGEGVEPVKKIIKNSAFNYLRNNIENGFEKKKICDLFAGSGNLGIESLSNNADWVDFVEQIPANANIIKQNLNNLNLTENSEVFTKDALKYITKSKTKYDIVFADPPYAIPVGHLLKNIYKILSKNGIFVYFHQKSTLELKTTNLELMTSRIFGKSGFSVYKLAKNV